MSVSGIFFTEEEGMGWFQKKYQNFRHIIFQMTKKALFPTTSPKHELYGVTISFFKVNYEELK